MRKCMATLFYLLFGCLLVAQQSCLTVIDRTIPGSIVQRESSVTSQDTPEAKLLPHPDHQGWTVSLTQPLLRHIEIVRSEQKVQHSYYPNPLAIPAGVFACPSSVWGWFWNAVATIPDPKRQVEQPKALVDFTFTSCLMALSIARTDRKLTDVETVAEHKLATDSRPLTDGRVTLSWHGTRDATVPYPVQADGRAVVRLSHLATALRQQGLSFAAVPRGRINLIAWHQDQELRRWPLEITAEQLEVAQRMEAPVMAPRSRWPRSLVFKLASESVSPDLRDSVNTLQGLLLQQGLTVVTSETQQSLIRRELEQNLNGMVEDDLAMGPGHWRAATVLVLINGSRGVDRSEVSISCLNIQTREVLVRIDVTAVPEGLSGALDVLAARFQDVLRQLAPSTSAGR